MEREPTYRNSDCSIDDRVEDLLSRMNVEEKTEQLVAELSDGFWIEKVDGELRISEPLKAILRDPPCGKLALPLRSDFFATRSLDLAPNPAEGARLSNELQRFVSEHTRLGIPVLTGNDDNRCHLGWGSTIFPSVLNMGCTWDQDLQFRVARAIAAEGRSRGEHYAYAPNLDVIRDPRFGRSDQNYGEDPYHAAEMGVAMVRGLQGDSLNSRDAMGAMLRAYPGAGEMDGGHDFAELNLGERDMQEVVLYPFARAIKAGAKGVMVERSIYDGVPAIASRYYLTDLLREEWGFTGVTMADAFGVQHLTHDWMRIARNNLEAAAMALKAGLDQSMPDGLTSERLAGSREMRAYGRLPDALDRGLTEMKDIDTAVRRVLRIKFEMGLFDDPYVDPEFAEEVNRCAEHLDLAAEAARKSIVLLENRNGILPLSKNVKKVAVIGPNAHDHVAQIGDYAPLHDEANVSTVLQGIASILPAGAELSYSRGCGIREMTRDGFAEAIQAATEADVVVAVVGGSSSGIMVERDGVLRGERSPEADCGEGQTRANLDFSGVQLDLLKALKETASPLVVVLIHGRPISEPWLTETADALVDASYPGEAGGRAVAEVLFGDYSPGGRLTVSVPISVGQLPVCYYYRVRERYVEMDHTPLYPFGYGLSYTTFEYSDLVVDPQTISSDESAMVSVEVTNAGEVQGDEVVQFYIRDDLSSVVRFNKQLRGFQRISLQPGETRRVTFEIGFDELCFYGPHRTWIVEPGDFTLMVGGDSATPRVTGKLTVR